MAKLTVVGSSNTDMVIKTPRFPLPGETIIGGDFFMFPGGKGGNQAVAAARMGGEVSFICCLGDDVFGRQSLEGYNKEGIDTSGILLLKDVPSGVALITVNAQAENEIVVASGANNSLSAEHLRANKAKIEETGLVLTQLETPVSVVAELASLCRNSDIPLIINPAPAQELSDDILDGLYLITPNETETHILTGIEISDKESASRAASALLIKGVRNIIITMGKRGAFFKNAEEEFTVLPPKVEAVDTTAAGDVFNGALAVCLAEQMSWKESIDLASRAAAVSVTRMGAQASAPYKKEVIKEW